VTDTEGRDIIHTCRAGDESGRKDAPEPQAPRLPDVPLPSVLDPDAPAIDWAYYGRRLREERTRQRFSQQLAAERAGVSYRTWSRIENGEGHDGSEIGPVFRAGLAVGMSPAQVATILFRAQSDGGESPAPESDLDRLMRVNVQLFLDLLHVSPLAAEEVAYAFRDTMVGVLHRAKARAKARRRRDRERDGDQPAAAPAPGRAPSPGGTPRGTSGSG
jgi:transcriptional regulator with XRE-family HTH domain